MSQWPRARLCSWAVGVLLTLGHHDLDQWDWVEVKLDRWYRKKSSNTETQSGEILKWAIRLPSSLLKKKTKSRSFQATGLWQTPIPTLTMLMPELIFSPHQQTEPSCTQILGSARCINHDWKAVLFQSCPIGLEVSTEPTHTEAITDQVSEHKTKYSMGSGSPRCAYRGVRWEKKKQKKK